MNNEIILPVQELKMALAGFNKIIGKRTTLPILGCIKVKRDEIGTITLQATNLDGFATFTLAFPQKGDPIEVLVPLEHLNKAFKCSAETKQDVALVCEGKTTKLRYYISGNPVTNPIETLDVSDWPTTPKITVENYLLQPGFGLALKQAFQCCSDDPNRQIMNGVCLDAREESSHYVVSTNGSFLFSANSFTFPLKGAVIIPSSKFITGSGLLDNEPCFIAIQSGKKSKDRKHICLSNKQWDYVTQEIEGTFPDWKQVFPKIDAAKDTLVKLSPAAIEQMLKVLPNLPVKNDRSNPIHVKTGKMSLWVKGQDEKTDAWTTIAIPDINALGQQKEIRLNRDYLMIALKFGLDEWTIVDEFAPILCRKEGKKMLIMPIRLKDENGNNNPPSESAPPTTEDKPTAEEQPEEEKETEMPKEPKAETKPVEPQPTAEPTLIHHIEQVKESLKNVLRDLGNLVDVVKQAERDKRTNEKELENARAVLKKLQQVSI